MKMTSISNKQNIYGMQNLLNSVKINKKKNLEDEFMGTAKLAKLDRKIQELRDKVDESSEESGDDSR